MFLTDPCQAQSMATTAPTDQLLALYLTTLTPGSPVVANGAGTPMKTILKMVGGQPVRCCVLVGGEYAGAASWFEVDATGTKPLSLSEAAKVLAR